MDSEPGPRSSNDPDATSIQSGLPQGSGPERRGRSTCANCGEFLEEGSLYCQACGTEASAVKDSFADEERARPWFAVLTAVWLVLMVAAMILLLTNAIQVGSP